MKRVLKAIAKACWRATGPLRRPLSRKFQTVVSRLLTTALQEQVAAPILPRLDAALAKLDGLQAGLNHARLEWNVQGTDANLALDSLIREVARLQLQVEALQQAVDEGDGAGAIHPLPTEAMEHGPWPQDRALAG